MNKLCRVNLELLVRNVVTVTIQRDTAYYNKRFHLFACGCDLICIQQFRERLSDESVASPRQDPMVVWVFMEILHTGAEEIYKFVFLRVKY